MRTAFIHALLEEAEKDPNLHLLTGDIGFSVLEPFAERFPERFHNVGVAEALMTGMAAGLAMSGKRVFTYSIANFPTLRCLEQIRNDVCYHNLDVTIVSVGAGLAYGSLGYSHHGLEDIAIMRTLPNLQVISPADPRETEALLPKRGPAYFRLGKANESVLHSEPIIPGKSIVIKQGSGPLILATGSILSIALQVEDATVVSVPFLKPFDPSILEGADHVITLEEHGAGGLASIVAEHLVGRACRFTPIFVREPTTEAGSQNYLRERLHLSAKTVQAALA
ncbi:MAG: hypothetical protein MRY21_01015 [Simkaniaceae bacterium]|nr:hypothetical protein [Simkaniaceae bacterium]